MLRLITRKYFNKMPSAYFIKKLKAVNQKKTNKLFTKKRNSSNSIRKYSKQSIFSLPTKTNNILQLFSLQSIFVILFFSYFKGKSIAWNRILLFEKKFCSDQKKMKMANVNYRCANKLLDAGSNNQIDNGNRMNRIVAAFIICWSNPLFSFFSGQ